ncbi:MAG: nitroreductase family protein [Planctomycetota bacterium]|nr:nitroreductase family protein [Planctomycetota bacterium]
MDLYETIKKRTSVRKYQDKPVEDDKLQRILDAGRLAPSANNRQARKFVVVRNEELRAALAEAAEQPWIAQAPVVIAVVGLDTDRTMSCGVPADPVDCAIAIDHMTLAAVAEGLGTCWVGHFDQDACCNILSVPPAAKIIELLPLGYPSAKQKANTRKPLKEIVSYDTFA